VRSNTTTGLLIAVSASLAFGLSGTLAKPLFELGWSPAAAVTARSLIGGLVLLAPALVALRGRWSLLWSARGRIFAMALVGVAGTQLVYYAAIARLPVSTAILIEYTAPVLLVAVAWATSRQMPRKLVLAGSLVAMAGLAFVVSPSGTGLDGLGLVFAVLSAIGCAVYYVVAARPAEGLPPLALAAAGLLIGGVALGAVGLTGLVPFTAVGGDVALGGVLTVPVWLALLVLGTVATGYGYAASITGSSMLGSQLAAFAGLLEVVAAALYAWFLLGEALTPSQAVGGLAILAGIVLVRWQPRTREPALITGAIPSVLDPDRVDSTLSPATSPISIITSPISTITSPVATMTAPIQVVRLSD
jgi:drug/metabolite transporter (DMT)-like permease